ICHPQEVPPGGAFPDAFRESSCLVQAQFFQRLCLDKSEEQLAESFRGERVNSLPYFRRQRPETRFQLQQENLAPLFEPPVLPRLIVPGHGHGFPTTPRTKGLVTRPPRERFRLQDPVPAAIALRPPRGTGRAGALPAQSAAVLALPR